MKNPAEAAYSLPFITEKYEGCMREIVARGNLINDYLKLLADGVVTAFDIENSMLQLRKIMELIALSSMVANEQRYKQAFEEIEKSWKVHPMLRTLERVNPGFYPVALIESNENTAGTDVRLLDRDPSTYLTRDDFKDAYDKCAKLLHAKNPFAPEHDYQAIAEWIVQTHQKIIYLLNIHRIRLVDDDHLYVFQMSRNGVPALTVFTQTGTI